MVTFKQLVKYKTSLGKAESLREFGQWYNNKWKTDYPMAYNNRWKRRRLMVTGRSKRRSRQYARVKALRARKGSKPWSRSDVGERVGTSTVKKHWTQADWGLYDTRTVHATQLTDIPKTNSNNINDRQRDIINCRGFNIWFDFELVDIPNFGYVNMAVVAPKKELTITMTDFFRAGGDVLGRGTFFGNFLNSQQMAHMPLNPEKFTILLHKRWVINESGKGIGGQSWRTYHKYVKLNRQISYRTDGTCEDPVWVMWWCDQAGVGSGDTPVAGKLVAAYMSETLFKEPKSC